MRPTRFYAFYQLKQLPSLDISLTSLKNATYGTIIVNTPYSLTQQVGYRKNSQLREVVLLCHWDCICNDHLLKQAT